VARNSRLHTPDRPCGLLEPCAATSGKHGSEEGGAGKRRPLSDMHHYVRDVVLGEDASRTRSAYRAMAAIRNTVTGILHLHQIPNIAAQLRACHRDPYQLPLLLLGLMTPLAPNGNPAVT